MFVKDLLGAFKYLFKYIIGLSPILIYLIAMKYMTVYTYVKIIFN